MLTFGDKLRQERERRNAEIRDVAERTRIGLRYLEALENNDFDALPGPRGFGKLYIRAYAEMLGFDPRPLIRAFEEEHHRRSSTERGKSSPRAPRARRVRFVPAPRRPLPARAEAAGSEQPGGLESVHAGKPATAAPETSLESRAAQETEVAGEPREVAESEDDGLQVASPEPEAVPEPEIEPRPETTAVAKPDLEPAEAPRPESTAGPEAQPPELQEAAGPTAAVEPLAAKARKLTQLGHGWIAAVVLTVTALVVAVGILPRPRQESPPPSGTAEPATTTVPPEISSSDPRASGAEGQDAGPQTPAAPLQAAVVPEVVDEPPVAAGDPAPLSVTEFGVGTDVVDRRLVGRGTRFVEGSTVAFFTRVVGGAAGRKIHHVWLREGRIVQRIELSVESAHWRTYSTKTLWGQGDWAVEARRADGQVLARSEFICAAP